VAIDPDTLEMTVLSDYSEVAYDGAGMGPDGMIYASVNGRYVQINISNGFATVTGAAVSYSMPIMDGTSSAPAQQIVLKDQKNDADREVTVGGYMYYGADDWDVPYLVKLFDYSAGTTKNHYYGGMDTYAAAIAYIGCEQVDAYYFYEYYLAVNSSGELYKLTEKTKVYDNTLGWQRSAELIADLGLNVKNGASMEMLSGTVAMISVSGASGVELYSFDLTTNTLKSLGTLAGVTDLVGLSLLSEVQAAETTAKAQRPSATFSVPASDNAAGKDAQNDGVTIAGNTVKIDLVEAQNVTNGKLVVTFDPGKLTFQSITGAGTLIAVNDSMAAEGKLIIAYAAGSAISAGDVLASLVFAYEGEYVTTQVTISAEQRNELDSVTEDATVVVIDNYVPSADNTLKDLSVEEGTLTPAFDSNVTEYTVQVPYEVEKLTVLATLNDERAAVVISDTALTDVGTVVITVTVTAENGDVKVYTITATRNACTHQHTEIIPGKAPTCTETGLTEGKKCTVCGETLVAQEVLPANGHTEETIPGKAPTCTETGLTEGKKCTVCGETLVAQDEIPATEHYFEHGFCVDCGAPGGSPTTGDPMVAVLCAVVFSGLGMALVIRKKKD